MGSFFCRAYGKMSFDVKKARKNIGKQLREADQCNCNTFRLGGSEHIGPQKGWDIPLVIAYRGLNSQIEIKRWHNPRTIDVSVSLEANVFFSSTDLTTWFYQLALKERSRNLTVFILQLDSTSGNDYQWDWHLHLKRFKI